ncbi:60S ribosomal protein L31 [Saitozyma podzolica]|uniref:60S ribosomal protein L31 n=1 Tax=Saitozyma podzolica TaxID=1890683 RepID=A0A427XTP0_9TREE|nr:60S ribosomal protein L31 [Saitozyma podzolica]
MAAVLGHLAVRTKEKQAPRQRSALHDVVTREYTINVHKRTHDLGFKKKAPKAIKAVVAFAQKTMGVKDVRLTPGLNQAIWSRARLEIEPSFFTASHADPSSPRPAQLGLQTVVIEGDE